MEEKRRKKKKMQPSPSHRESAPENHRVHHKKTIGCMSGILQLLSRHHSRRRIPSARKDRIETPPTSTSTPIVQQPDFTEVNTARTPVNADLEFSSEAGGLSRRSPTLPSEIRRSGGCFDRGDSPRQSPALVARLMGLEDPPQQWQLPKPPPASESAEEKRRKLLGALERCDEDLRSLKRIIDAVRAAEMIHMKDETESPIQELKFLDGNGEQPSPVSVLDGISSPKFCASENEEVQNKSLSSVEVSCHVPRRITIEGIRRPPSDHKRILKDHTVAADSSSLAAVKSFTAGWWRWRWRRSKAMVESIGEVGEDAICEERREVVRVGVDLADDVLGDLVDQLIIELVESCSKLCLQTVRCKRKLCL
ncbi:hypothetical protein IEQ34_016124 [Dendrobium chrysotoxum]|uniref:DUF3741 domain-containing protein n=1 Tax=Dendrobium chrysotoxum TaxID=161865 RepID=A0AAV7FWS8_DENCH|nr:hypothetical protein IEQ34_016124 [Dendrobium chrysotoxum]